MIDMPDYPDPMETAQAQAGMNLDSVIGSALVNNYSQYTPWGSSTYTQDGTNSFTNSQGEVVEVPHFVHNVNLSPDQAVTWGNMSGAYQNLSGAANSLSGFLSQYLATPFDPNYTTSVDASTASAPVTSWQAYSGGDLENAFQNWYATQAGSGGGAQAAITPYSGDTFAEWMDTLHDSDSDTPTAQYLLDEYQGQLNPDIDTSGLTFVDWGHGGAQGTEQPNVTDSEAWQELYNLWQHDQAQSHYVDQLMAGGGGTGSGLSYDDAYAQFMADAANAQEGDTRFGAWNTTPGSIGTITQTPSGLVGWDEWNVDDFGEQVSAVENALMSRYDQRFALDEAAMDAKLRAQGLQPGTAAYATQFDALTRQRNDARMQAILAGGQEHSRLNQLAQAEAAFNNQLHMNQLAEALTIRNQPINEITGLLSGSQLQMPQFTAPFQAGVQAPNYMQLVDNAYQAEAANAQAQGQGLFSILGMIPGLFGMSDRRTKRDVRRLGRVGSIPVYTWRYIGGTEWHVGFMADEVDKRAVKHIGGVAHVDYREAIRHAG